MTCEKHGGDTGHVKDSKMRVLDLKRSPLSIQKCLLPDCEFLRENYGRYCVVAVNKCQFLVRLGLCEVKHIHDSLFLNSSVSVVSSLESDSRTNSHKDINFKDFVVAGKPQFASAVNVTVVFVNFLDVKKYRTSQNVKAVVRDILKLFVFCNNSVIRLHDLDKNRTFGMSCLFIEKVNGSKPAEIFTVDSNTEIIIEGCTGQLKFEQFHEEKNLIEVGGCGIVYSILKETIEFAKCLSEKRVKFVNKLLLIGPAGCGKSLLVRNVARDCKCILLEISPSDINTLSAVDVGKKLGSIFEEAKFYTENKECCVILIEDIDLMSSGKTLHAKRFVGELITLLEEVDNVAGVVVVATTNSPDEVDLKLRRAKRLEDELEMTVPTGEERAEILEKILNQFGVKFEIELLQQVSEWTPGFVGADLRLLAFEALLISRRRKGCLEDGEQLKDCFKEALRKVIPSALRGAVALCTGNSVTFSQIGGLDEVKRVLDLSVKQQLENPEKFRKFGIPPTKGILLYGPPGCAKTTLVRALAKECNATFLATSAADLYSPFVGDAEKKIVLLFAQARLGSPAILFIDEIDAVVGNKSGDRERGVQERILSTLLVEMDGVGLKVNTQGNKFLNLLGDGSKGTTETNSTSVIVVGATNRPQMLDDALIRPGRFDRLLHIPAPDREERHDILKKLTGKMRLGDCVDLRRLAELTAFYSGADLKNLCQEAGIHALNSMGMAADSVRQVDFEYVLGDYKPSLSERIVAFYESFQKYNV